MRTISYHAYKLGILKKMVDEGVISPSVLKEFEIWEESEALKLENIKKSVIVYRLCIKHRLSRKQIYLILKKHTG